MLKERDSPLLNRKRVSFMVEYEGKCTPNILEFKDAIASKLKVNKDLVSVRHVYQRFGYSKAKVIAHIYQTRKELMRLEKFKKAEKKAEEKAKLEAEEKAKAEVEAKKAIEEAKKAEEEENN